MNILSFNSYRDVLIEKIRENKAIYGYKARLAEAALCQRPYLSQVLATRAHLTPEQALRLCTYWHLNAQETRYFMALVNRDRSGSAELRDYHDHTLKQLRAESETLSKRYSQDDLPTDEQAVYYSSWLYSALHMLISVPEYQTPSRLTGRLGVPLKSVSLGLSQLAALGLAKESQGRWTATKKVVHVSNKSLFNVLNHSNWRHRAVLDAAQCSPGSIHYTAIYSLSLKDKARLKNLLLELIDKSRAIVEPSKEEDVVCMAFDFFEA